MNTEKNIQGYTETVVYRLRKLYSNYGYAQYKMNKFEEYDLYVRNKSFLLSENIITFTNIDGKLMALKPDVTLSIVKGSRTGDSLTKVYYNENVYRVPKGALSFKEIMQTGLECIGNIDGYSVLEVLTLAAKSLEVISPDFVLDISDLGIISALVDSMGADGDGRLKLFEAVSKKSSHAILNICDELSLDKDKACTLAALVSFGGGADEMLEILKDQDIYSEAESLANTVSMLSSRFGGRVRIDFSVVDDMRYYNGIVFKGFVKGIPAAVLSGGRYDGLLSRMGKRGGAIGFAVYLDLLEKLEEDNDQFDVDVFLLYGEDTTPLDIADAAARCVECGKRTQSGKSIPDGLRYKELIRL